MTRRISSAAFALALLGIIAAAACGDSPTTPTPTPPSPPPVTPTPPPTPPAPPPTLGITKVLAFGDSMTEGTTSPPLATWTFRLDAGLSRSYPYKLQSLITSRYSAQTIQVFNGGKAGEFTYNARDRFNGLLSEARPEVVLLIEGANDLNTPFGPTEGVNARVTATVSNIEDMVRDAGFRGIPVMVATLPPQRPGAPKAGAATFLNRYNDALKSMAANKGAQLVDVGAQIPLAEIGQDGLHPTEAGYQHMAEIWLEAIKGRFER